MARTKNFADIIRAKIASSPDLAAAIAKESFNADLACKVYEARTEAGLTQQELAERAGTYQSVIARLEDADYNGHFFSLLNRIAKALGKDLRVDFSSSENKTIVPKKPKKQAGRKAVYFSAASRKINGGAKARRNTPSQVKPKSGKSPGN